MTLRRIREARGAMLSSPNGWGWNDPAAIPPPGMFSMQRAGVPVTAHTSLQVDAVFTALRVITNAVIRMGNPRAYRQQFDSQNRPYRAWLPNQPGILSNTFGDQFQFDGISRTVASLGLFGEAFWLTLTRNNMQYPTALEVLHPAFVKVEPDNKGGVTYWYGTGAQVRQLPNADVTHIPFLALPGAARGLSSIEYAGVSYALALAAMEFGQRWFSQGASPSYLLSTDTKLGNDEVQRIAERFLIEHSGLQAAHLPLVLDSGMKAQKILSTPDEAQFINTLEYARMCIAAWFGLPSHLVGGTGDRGMVWGRTVQEQSFQMVDFTLSGYTVRLNEAFGSLLPRGQQAALDESEILKADAAGLAAQIMAMRTTAVATQNDIRVPLLHLPPVDAGDDINAPLASNVAPGTVTDANGSATAASQAESPPAGGNEGNV